MLYAKYKIFLNDGKRALSQLIIFESNNNKFKFNLLTTMKRLITVKYKTL